MSQEERGRIGRNDPFWCNSGKKFKHCHQDRGDQERLPYHHFANNLKKTREGERRCLYPMVSGTCENPVIRAHSVSRNAALSLIARDGHVYQWNFDPFEIEKQQGKVLHQLVGINSATTFTGFCSSHDQQLFKPIDTGSLLPSQEQVFLLHYRAICRELYVKKPTLASNSALRDADRGRPVGFQSVLQQIVSGFDVSISSSLRELEDEKAICDAAILAQSFNEINALVIHFDQIPSIACSGNTQPIFDFAGNELQNLADMATPLAKLSFTLLPSTDGGIAIIAWLNKWGSICRQFADSFLAVPDNLKCSALVQWVFDSFENHALEPQWWESLSEKKKDELQLISLNWTTASPVLDSGSIVPSGTEFADWGFRSFEWI